MAPSASSPAPSSFHPAALPPFKRHVRTPSKSMQRFARKRRASSLSVARPVPQPPAALQPAPAAVDAAQAEASSSSSSSSAAEEHNFSCRICLSVPEGPVVTPCGHLACWKCLYSWLAMHPHAPSCPVCKAHCAMHDVLPIYGAGLEEKDPRAVPVPKPKPSQPSGSRRTRPSFNSLPCFADFCDSAPLPLLQQLGVLLALCLLSMLSSGPPLPIGGNSSSTAMSEISRFTSSAVSWL